MMKSRMVWDTSDIDYSISPSRLPVTDSKQWYTKCLTSCAELSEENKIRYMEALHQNFIDSQIKLGKRLYGFTFWGSIHLMGECDPSDPHDRPYHTIGWVAFSVKDKKEDDG